MDLKELADKINHIEDEIGLNLDASLNKLTQELGEFNDAIQKYRGIYCKNKGSISDIEEELGDVLFNITSICNRIGINPNEFPKYIAKTVKKLEERKNLYKSNISK